MKNILVINANPKSNSLCRSFAERYALVSSDKHNVEQLNIGEMDFEISLDKGYDTSTALEADLIKFQELIIWSDHIVIVSPVWWGTVPAKFKGIIDRTFLPNFAFKYEAERSVPTKLLCGRSAELIITLDTPPLWYRFVKGNVIYKHIKTSILDFSGIKNQSTTFFGPVMNSTPKKREAWLEKVTKMASKV